MKISMFLNRKKLIANATSDTSNPTYDVLSIARDISTYSSITTLQTQDQQYEIVFPRRDSNDT